jgi:hypothetical protein
MFRESCEAHSAKQDGGEEGIRTLEKLLTSTPLAGERLRPLGHLSGGSPVKKSRRTINKAFGLGARSGVNFGRRLSSGRTGGARYARASARHHFQTIYIASIHRVRLLEAPLDRRARRITGLSGWPADLKVGASRQTPRPDGADKTGDGGPPRRHFVLHCAKCPFRGQPIVTFPQQHPGFGAAAGQKRHDCVEPAKKSGQKHSRGTRRSGIVSKNSETEMTT